MSLALCAMTVVPAGQPAWASPPTNAPAPPPDPTAASDIRVQTSVEPQPSHVGDVVRVIVDADFPRGVSVNLPLGLSLAPMELRGIEDSGITYDGDRGKRRFVLDVQHFEVESRPLPSLALTVVAADGQVRTLDLPPTTIAVEALLANEVDPVRRGEDDPVSLVYPAYWLEGVIFTALAALVLGAVCTWLMLWLRRRRDLAPPPPPIPAHVVALRSIARLEPQLAERVRKGEIVEVHLELTQILKDYLDGRFGIPAREWTTDELRRGLRPHEATIAPLSPEELLTFCEESDLVKFARFLPVLAEVERALRTVRSFVERTLPQREPAAETPAEGEGTRESTHAGGDSAAGARLRAPTHDGTPRPTAASTDDDAHGGGGS